MGSSNPQRLTDIQRSSQPADEPCMAPEIIQVDQDELSLPVQPHDLFFFNMYTQFKKLNIFMVVFFSTHKRLRDCSCEKTGAGKHTRVSQPRRLKQQLISISNCFPKLMYEQKVIPNEPHDSHRVSRINISPCLPKL